MPLNESNVHIARVTLLMTFFKPFSAVANFLKCNISCSCASVSEDLCCTMNVVSWV